ncbi:MAG: DUF177 domain-containing protein [Alphaproteobacteria bacterium]|nr:DUF177 domain-containing protein [Alphaproteobacteria bacterium]
MQKEFSLPLIVEDLPQTEQHYKMLATADNLQYVAKILQVPEVKFLEADFFVKNNHRNSILNVSGHIKAELTIQSVISLETFKQGYDFDFSTDFDTKATLDSQKEEYDDWDKEIPEIVIGGKIDLGDIAIEQIALKLDSYPRIKGETFNFKPDFDVNEKPENPFAALSKLKR